MAKFQIDAHISPSVLREIADTHPRLRELRATLRTRHQMTDRQARAFVRRLLVAVLDDFGGHYVSEMSARIERVISLRERISDVYDGVINGAGFPEGVTPRQVEGWFRELDTEMDALHSPTRRAHEQGPLIRDDLVSDVLSSPEVAGEVGVPARPASVPGVTGRPRIPGDARDRFVAALRTLDPDMQAKLSEAADLDPDLLRRALFAEAEENFVAAQRELADLLRRHGRSEGEIAGMQEAIRQINLDHRRSRRAEEQAAYQPSLQQLTGQAARPDAPLSVLDVIDPIVPLADHPLVQAFRGMPEAQQGLVTRAARNAPDLVRRALLSDDPSVRQSALRDLGDLMRREGRSDAEIRDARLGLERMRQAHEQVQTTGLQSLLTSPPDQRFVTEVNRAPTFFSRLASNPEMVRALYAEYRRSGSRGTFRAYVDLRMRTHIRGMVGEFTAAFDLGEGFYFLKGPDYDVTIPGTDLVAVVRNTGEVWLIDNKALSAEELQSVSSLTRNLPTNIGDDVSAFRAALRGQSGLPAEIQTAMQRLTRARDRIRRLTRGKSKAEVDAMGERIAAICQEEGIRLVVTNAGGNVSGLSDRLRALGIELEDLR